MAEVHEPQCVEGQTPAIAPVQTPATSNTLAGASYAEQSQALSCAPKSAESPSLIASPVPGVHKAGFIDHSDGSNIRTGPGEAGGKALTSSPLPPATRVFVSGKHPDTPDWWYITATTPSAILRGYVQHFRVNTELPEPTAQLYQIRPGDTAEDLAVRQFSQHIRPGQDLRFYENVLLYVNKEAGRAGVRGTYQSPNIFGGGSNNIQLEAGRRIWLVSPIFAKALGGKIPSGSLTGGAVARARSALQHVEDLVASVVNSRHFIGTIGQEYYEVIKEHLPEIIGMVAAFIVAESAATFLALSPTGVGQIAAVVIQMILALIAGHAAITAGAQALSHGKEWLTTAWGANGNQAQLDEASKQFLHMLVQIAMAALAVAGVRGHVGRGLKVADAVKVTPPKLAMSSGGIGPGGAATMGGPIFTPGSISTTGPVNIAPRPLSSGVYMMAGKGRRGANSKGAGTGRGQARNPYTNAQAKEAAEAAGYKRTGSTNQHEPIYSKRRGDPPFLVKSRTGHTGEMFKGFKSMKQAQKGDTETSGRLGSYDKNIIRVAD